MTALPARRTRSKAAFMDWVQERATELAGDLDRSRAAAPSRNMRADLRLSLAHMLRCADFVLEVSDASRSLTPVTGVSGLAEYVALDIGHLRSKGFLTEVEEHGVLSLWQRGVMLSFSIGRLPTGDSELLIGASGAEQRLEISTTLPSFGGVRYWFVCPGCHSRLLRLYRLTTGDSFLCRSCHKVSHDSGWRTARDRRVLAPVIQGDEPL